MTALSPFLSSASSTAILSPDVPCTAGRNHLCVDLAEPAASIPDAMLRQIMSLAGLALWEAWFPSLELIGFEIGAAHSIFDLDSTQRQPGASWLESVYPSDREKLQ